MLRIRVLQPVTTKQMLRHFAAPLGISSSVSKASRAWYRASLPVLDSSLPSDSVPKASAMKAALESSLKATRVEVTDVSGGCGAFFKVLVVADAFAGVPTVRAHRMVLDALEKDVGKMHGLTIETRKS